MSENSDRDLSAAFEDLRAPESTANYTTRTPGLDVPSTRSRWPQAVAGVLAIALAVAGAGTFLALRSARQGGAPASSTGNPPARSGAALAYDSAAGVTVMYGGTDGSGTTLTDTWTWDGSTWTAAAKGPGQLVDVRMVDDPADAGVLLLGLPASPASGGSGSAGGCVSSGSGTTGGGSVSSGGTPVPSAVAPAIATAPSTLPTPVPSGTIPPPTCPPIAAAPTEQTWLFGGHGWNRAAAGASATTPSGGAQLTFDSTTRQVVAVSSGFLSCGPPLESATSDAAIACPLLGAGSKSGTTTAIAPVPCDAVGLCQGTGTIATWTWSGGHWITQPAVTLHMTGTRITLLFNDPATDHATLMTQFGLGNDQCPGVTAQSPPSTPSCPAPVHLVATWSWTGTAWNQLSQVYTPQAGPSVAGASVAAVSGHVVVVTTTGETWTFAAGQWTQDIVANGPSIRSGAAMAAGRSGTVVLFGGAVGSGFAVASSGGSGGSVGSDTWVWNATSWKYAGGTAPSPPPTPTTCPTLSTGLTPACVFPPTKILPATPAGVPPRAKGSPIPATIP